MRTAPDDGLRQCGQTDRREFVGAIHNIQILMPVQSPSVVSSHADHEGDVVPDDPISRLLITTLAVRLDDLLGHRS
jgi:hypothetical protein